MAETEDWQGLGAKGRVIEVMRLPADILRPDRHPARRKEAGEALGRARFLSFSQLKTREDRRWDSYMATMHSNNGTNLFLCS